MLSEERAKQYAISILAACGVKVASADSGDTAPRTIGQAVRMLLRENGRADALEMNGVQVRDALFEAVRMMGTNDLKTLLSTTPEVAMQAGWKRAADLTTYQHLTQIVRVDDLQHNTITRLTDAPEVFEIPEGQAPQLGVVADAGQPARLARYGRALLLTEQAVENDKLDILGILPERLGGAMRRKINSLLWRSILTGTGPTMAEDNVALFAHANVAPAAALSAASLSAAIGQMMGFTKQSPDGGRSADLSTVLPRYLVCTPADLTTALQLAGSAYIGGGEKQGWKLDVLAEPLLATVSGGSPWLLVADPTVIDHACIVNLVGGETPSVTTRLGGIGQAKGIYVDISQFIAVYVTDWRGWLINRGA